ncbi:MAG: pyridoxal phosphate-dependent aminotransferase [Eubacteriaceae bacterium]
MEISQRIQQMKEPALLKYYPLVNRAKEKGKKVYFLNIGQPDIPTPPVFLEKLHHLEETVLAYEASEGMMPLRKAAIRYYKGLGLNVEVDHLFVTNGGSEGLLFGFIGTCNPGDEIITPEPLYSIYKEIAAATNVKLVGIKTYAENGFALPDTQEIEKLITPKTRAILITNPGNPTGKVFTKNEIETLKALVLKYQLYFISDEVYREFLYDGQVYQSPGHDEALQNNTIIVDSISKRYSVCGARIGFIISKNRQLMEEIKKCCQMRLSVSTVDQIGATALFDLDQDFFDGILTEYSRRREIVYEALKEIPGVVCKKPKGAFYFMAKLPILDACHFIEWMITDFEVEGETILLSPANDFYLDPKDGKDEVRIATVLKVDDMLKAMEILKKGLENYRITFPNHWK